ncbi:MAG: hypothetical protein ACM3NQ_13650 [Bacteroidales bacterium]
MPDATAQRRQSRERCVEDTGPLTIRDTSGDITVRRAASLDIIAKESGQISATGISGPIHVPAGFKVVQKNP